jgi:hypothetical protein
MTIKKQIKTHMKSNSFLLVAFGVGLIALSFMGCRKDRNCNESNNSASGENRSHNFGQNCLNCHTSGGEGEGCFQAAGSVTDGTILTHVVSGTVKFFTEPNGAGQLKYSIPIDSKGNFYTTESISINGLFPAIIGPSGVAHYMSSSVSTGACNSCHGVSTSKLWAQ